MATSFPTSPMPQAMRRPAGVTLVVILTWLAAIGDVIGGIAFITNADDRSLRHDLGLTVNEMRWYGAFMIGLGVLTALVALGLGRGAGWARMLVALVMCLHIAGGVYALTQASWNDQRSEAVSAIAQIGFSTLILVMLFGSKADRFFSQRRY